MGNRNYQRDQVPITVDWSYGADYVYLGCQFFLAVAVMVSQIQPESYNIQSLMIFLFKA